MECLCAYTSDSIPCIWQIIKKGVVDSRAVCEVLIIESKEEKK